jgi:hypothetical protein
MFTAQPTGLTGWFTTTDVAVIIALAVGLGALILALDVIARRLTARARERARIRAGAWAADRARAARRRRRVRVRARAVAASFMDTPGARRALLAVLALTAVAATVLSAHGIQDSLTNVGMTAWWVRVAGFTAFEGFLLVMFALSWWHRTTSQEGFDIYGAVTWAGAGVLALVGYHGGGDWIYALFAPMAAAGFHLTAGAERRRRGGAPSWAARAGAAARARVEAVLVLLGRTPTSADTNARDRERRRARVADRFVKARRATVITRAVRVRAFDRAVAAAGARGLLDTAGRAVVADLVTTRLGAFDALGALAGASAVWGAPSAVAAPEAPPVPEPDPEPEPPARAPLATVSELRAPEPDPGHDDLPARLLAAFAGPTEAAVWAVEHYRDTGALPTGAALGERFETHPGNARKWLSPARTVLEAAAA